MTRLTMLHRRFAESQDGAIAIYFTFLLLAFCMLLGLTIDGGRAIFTKTEMNEALDSATLAATRALMTGNQPMPISSCWRPTISTKTCPTGALGEQSTSRCKCTSTASPRP